MESLDIGSRHSIQTLKEALAKGLQSQPTKGWAVTDMVLDSLQHLLIAKYHTIFRLGSVPDSCQRPNLTVPRNKPRNFMKFFSDKVKTNDEHMSLTIVEV